MLDGIRSILWHYGFALVMREGKFSLVRMADGAFMGRGTAQEMLAQVEKERRHG